MTTFNTLAPVPCVSCQWPRSTYRTDDLTGEQHTALREQFARAAEWDGLDPEAAQEAASVFYLQWLGRPYGRLPIARGDHRWAYRSVLKYARLSAWKGFTGYRRGKNAAATAERLAWMQRRREASQQTPASVAIGMERIATTPCHARKAYRLARKLGLPGVRELIHAACGFAAE